MALKQIVFVALCSAYCCRVKYDGFIDCDQEKITVTTISKSRTILKGTCTIFFISFDFLVVKSKNKLFLRINSIH